MGTRESEIQLTYEKLWKQAVHSIESNTLKMDPHLGRKSLDARWGLTLICRPSHSVRESVMAFLNKARKIEPCQHYYIPEELHTTVLTIITCHENFQYNEIDIPSYISILAKSVSSISPFNIRYRGISASPECVIIQGFPEGDGLQNLRERVREHFRKSQLRSTLDERFKTHTAHLTCLRFQAPLTSEGGEFLHFLEQNRSLDFGTSDIAELEFVVNDWYMSRDKVEFLHRFCL